MKQRRWMHRKAASVDLYSKGKTSNYLPKLNEDRKIAIKLNRYSFQVIGNSMKKKGKFEIEKIPEIDSDLEESPKKSSLSRHLKDLACFARNQQSSRIGRASPFVKRFNRNVEKLFSPVSKRCFVSQSPTKGTKEILKLII